MFALVDQPGIGNPHAGPAALAFRRYALETHRRRPASGSILTRSADVLGLDSAEGRAAARRGIVAGPERSAYGSAVD